MLAGLATMALLACGQGTPVAADKKADGAASGGLAVTVPQPDARRWWHHRRDDEPDHYLAQQQARRVGQHHR